METTVYWISLFLFSCLVSHFAVKKGRNGLGWFALAFLLSPLLAGIFLYFSDDLAEVK